MAIIKDYLADGVPQSEFDVHTHNYRKMTEVAVSKDHTYDPVDRFPLSDDTETVAFSGNNLDLEAVGVTVATQPTEIPNA